MKKCIDCKWVYDANNGILRCTRPSFVGLTRQQKHTNKIRTLMGTKLIEPDSHEPKYDGKCFSHREDGWLACLVNQTCGKRGRWWEPKLPINQLIDHVNRNGVIK